MLIDWFTVGAQALNFLILVWLLKRFLYKPILHAIDEREKRIAKELADADAKKAEAAYPARHRIEIDGRGIAAVIRKIFSRAEIRCRWLPHVDKSSKPSAHRHDHQTEHWNVAVANGGTGKNFGRSGN